ncbi:acyl-CoA thioesterase-2 [Ferrithrix thermotolerans DSM 19514]|uniref:Acyl-CoA thioesterase 2 n=1 Tax=Ferrithrix thermotolerans DSM 19514 TaxID=1121881 RepID=A0A1M4XQ77_9ACTN|nr:acyl-CoA thioesterase II [Ferrithrix thermotolerans]SHE95580.1 acyl-CoA thioesterase-2 [Ferrithrix thermotolerans DSM 19514]
MENALDDLLRILDLKKLEEDYYQGESPKEERQRVFGGQVAGQALVAAGRTVSRGAVHSLHAYFLRPGDPNIPILYQVDRIRDGSSFTTRRVVAYQHGKAIFNLSASFHIAEDGVSHQPEMPVVPDPEELPTFEERMAPWIGSSSPKRQDWITRPKPIDQRFIDPVGKVLYSIDKMPIQRVWMRADGTLPDDPLIHACVVAYASDMSLLNSAMVPHGLSWDSDNVMAASLDHAMWFHRPFRADEWFLYDQESPNAYGARALARGHIFSRNGDLIVSVVQEGLVRTF